MPSNCEIKYVIVDYSFPIIFYIPFHVDMKPHGNITSAAYFKIVNGKVQTYGRSKSLNMTFDPDDAHIIEHFLGLSS